MKRVVILVVPLVLACVTREQPGPRGDSARRAFADTVAAMLLDTTLFELRGHLFVKIRNPNPDDESPLVDSAVPHPAEPGPHTMNGVLYAELDALRDLLGRDRQVRVDTARGQVFVGTPPVLLIAHRHGGGVYVAVRLFARQFGAYTDIRCTLANCGHVWTADVIAYMKSIGAIGGAGIIEGHADGIVRDVDVTKQPTG